MLIGNLAVIIMTFLAYIAPSVNPNYTWFLSFFGLFYPVLILANFFFICYWIFRKWTRTWLSIACLAIGWQQFFTFMPINAPKPESEKDQLQVMNYNISNGLYGYDKSKDEQAIKKEAIISFLQEYNDVPIFCFQEVGDYGTEIIKKAFGKGYNLHAKDARGAAILTKYPIIRKGEIDFGVQTNSCLWADIKTPFDTLRVYSFHLQSNQISRDAEKFANQTEINQKEAWYNIKSMLRKVKNRHIKRSKQVNLIADHARKSKYKVLLGGDLNDPAQSYTYHVLSNIGRDAFHQVGSGIGTTYNGVIPLLRIDFMFVDPKLDIHACKVVRENYSDHFPVLTTVEWPED
jgi:endonuclease/exonuclease/phosphatase family metal-dependent hydrolase